MADKNTNTEKIEILKELLADEEHTIENLKRLVAKSKPFFKIIQVDTTGKILISREFPFSLTEKGILYLIGIYFSKEMGLNKDIQITSREICENIQVAQTSFSGPLGELVKQHIIKKDDVEYTIKYYNIEPQLDALTSKYLINPGVKKPQEPKTKYMIKKKNLKNYGAAIISKPQIKKEFNETHFKQIMDLHNLKDEQLNTIFHVENQTIILFRGFKTDNLSETHIKATLLTLAINKIYFDIDEISSSELRRILENSGIGNLVSLSTSLKNISSWIIHKRGPIGSKNTLYKLTSLGFQNGITLIKDILDNTKNLQLNVKSRIKKECSPQIAINREELEKSIKEFSKQNGFDEHKLKVAFDFQIDNLRLLIKINEQTRKTIQIKALMLLGIVLKRVYKIDSFDGRSLLKQSNLSYDRLDLLDSNTDYNSYFSKKPKSAMQLTYAGELKSIALLKEYLDVKNED